MSKTAWRLLVGGLFIALPVAFGLLNSNENPSLSYARQVAKAQGKTIEESQFTTNATVDDPTAVPRAEFATTDHTFGKMDPFAVGRHVFKVRNTGTGPLTLRKGATTCKCTEMEVVSKKLQPGEEGEIVLQWQTAGRQKRFVHGGNVLTNDPQQPSIQLRIRGEVITHLGAEPAEIIFSGIDPTTAAVAHTVIYSQLWEDVSLTNFESSLPGMRWEVAPANPHDLKEVDALAGRILTVYLPDDLPQGEFQHWLRFQVESTDPTVAAQTYQLPIVGKVLRRLAIYGRAIDGDGVIHLGSTSRNKALTIKLVMKVRDEDRRLNVKRIVSQPAFVKASITPYKIENNDAGLYHLEVEIPANAPPAVHLGAGRRGTLHVEFDHPRIKELDLQLDFLVEP